jgi:hypothetical protein
LYYITSAENHLSRRNPIFSKKTIVRTRIPSEVLEIILNLINHGLRQPVPKGGLRLIFTVALMEVSWH